MEEQDNKNSTTLFAVPPNEHVYHEQEQSPYPPSDMVSTTKVVVEPGDDCTPRSRTSNEDVRVHTRGEQQPIKEEGEKTTIDTNSSPSSSSLPVAMSLRYPARIVIDEDRRPDKNASSSPPAMDTLAYHPDDIGTNTIANNVAAIRAMAHARHQQIMDRSRKLAALSRLIPRSGKSRNGFSTAPSSSEDSKSGGTQSFVPPNHKVTEDAPSSPFLFNNQHTEEPTNRDVDQQKDDVRRVVVMDGALSQEEQDRNDEYGDEEEEEEDSDDDNEEEEIDKEENEQQARIRMYQTVEECMTSMVFMVDRVTRQPPLQQRLWMQGAQAFVQALCAGLAFLILYIFYIGYV